MRRCPSSAAVPAVVRPGSMLRSVSLKPETASDPLRVRVILRGAKRWVTRCAFCSTLLAVSTPNMSAAEDLALPAEVEAKLSGSVSNYERTLARRAGDKVVIAIITNPSDRDSARAGSQLQQAFREVALISKLPHEEFILPWTGPAALSEACIRIARSNHSGRDQGPSSASGSSAFGRSSSAASRDSRVR